MLTSEGWGNVGEIEVRYAPWVARLEQTAAVHPWSYRQKVIAAGLLGYVILGGLLAIPTAMIAVPFAGMLALDLQMSDFDIWAVALTLVGFMLYLALRLRRRGIAGVVLAPAQAPGLFATIERLRTAMTALAIDEVRICEEMTAGLVQEPRFGGLTSRNVLLLGLPAFYALTVPEMEAAIAHELAHAIGAHNRSMNFVIAVRRRWLQIGTRLPHGRIAWLLRRFFTWYGPWFVAFSQVLIRQNEYEADKAAVRVVGAASMASALMRFAVKSVQFEERQATRRAEAGRRGLTAATGLRRALADLSGNSQHDLGIVEWINALGTRLDDDHPLLARRLTAIGGAEVLSTSFSQTMATTLLGPTADLLVQLFARAEKVNV